MKHIIKDYFNYTRNELRGICLLLFIIALLIGYNIYYNRMVPEIDIQQYSDLEKKLTEIDSLQNIRKQAYQKKKEKSLNNYNDRKNNTWKEKKSNNNYKKNTTAKLLSIEKPLDPNTITKDELIRIGIPHKVAHTWTKFTSKGGSFKTPNDISKVYGLSEAHREQLIPYINIPTLNTRADSTILNIGKDSSEDSEEKLFPKVLLHIDLNQTIPEELELIYGIGPALSKRILQYRDKLGGFIDSTQLAGGGGWKDSTLHELYKNTIITGETNKIAINKATLDELKVHPYIKYNQAKVITKYRDNHGAYANWEDLLKVRVIPSDSKLKYYISYD